MYTHKYTHVEIFRLYISLIPRWGLMAAGCLLLFRQNKLFWMFIFKRAVSGVSAVWRMLIFLIFFGSNVLVVRIYNFYCIVNTTIANLLVVVLNISWYLWLFPECFFRNLKKYFSTSVFTFWWKEDCTIWYFWSGSSFYSMTPILLNSIWCSH